VVFLLAMGSDSPVRLWPLLHRFQPFASILNPAQMFPLFVLGLSIAAAAGLSRAAALLDRPLSSRPRAAAAVAGALVAACALDLAPRNRRLLREGYETPPPTVTPAAAFHQTRRATPYGPTSSHLPAFLGNRGLMPAYTHLPHPERAKAREDAGYRGEAYLAGGAGEARLLSVTANRFRVFARVTRDDTLVLNQNYVPGWRAGGRAAADHGGLPSIRVPPGEHTIVFSYSPPTLPVGVALTAVTAAVSVAATVRRRPRRAGPSGAPPRPPAP
jgi:hypothetical protein